MTAYIIRRIMHGLLVLLIVSFIVFIVMRLLPGDPLLIHMSEQGLENITAEQLQALRVEFGLDKPLMAQYAVWLGGLFRGDLGRSLIYTNEKISDIIAKRMPISMYIGFLAIVLSSTLGILAGVICAVRRGKWLDTVVTLIANLGITVPSFWLGILLIYLIGLRLGWLPICGYTSPFEDFWLSIRKVIMPSFCLSIFTMASIARQTRSSMLEVIRQDYIRTAKSKGFRERVIIMRHALKNSLTPVITMIGMHVRMVFGGTIIIETVFNIPGMGRMMVDAIFRQDYPIVQGGTLVIAAVVVMANLAVDLSYAWIDPRIRYS